MTALAIDGGYTNSPERLAKAVVAAQERRLLFITDNDGVLREQGQTPEEPGVMPAENFNALAVAAARTPAGVLSARLIRRLHREFGAIEGLHLVGSMGRTTFGDTGEIETHPDAIAARPFVEAAIPVAYKRLIDAGLVIPGMTEWDPRWDGFGMALFMRGIRDRVADLSRQAERTPDAGVDVSDLQTRLQEARARLATIASDTQAIFGAVVARLRTPRLAIEHGDGVIGLMSAHADGSRFTKADPIRVLFDRVSATGKAPTAVLYMGDEGGVNGRDTSGWAMVRELERMGLIEVGLTVGVDSARGDNLSVTDHEVLDVVLSGVPAVAGFMRGVTGDGFGPTLDRYAAGPLLGG